MSKRIKRAAENAQQCEERLSNNCVRKQNSLLNDRTNCQDAARSQVINDYCESDQKLIQFSVSSKIDKLSNNLCLFCNAYVVFNLDKNEASVTKYYYNGQYGECLIWKRFDIYSKILIMI
ncbi:unnamed protein product [Rhizophagus irregularis]|nr:unnamed protein product [Rhizophagus irregularis]